MSADYEPEKTKWDYIYYASWVLTVFFLGMWFVGWLGERLGWWNDIGEILMTMGRLAGLGLAGLTVVLGASRTQVHETKDAVLDTKDAVDETKNAVHETRDAVHETKTTLSRGQDKQVSVLEDIRDEL